MKIKIKKIPITLIPLLLFIMMSVIFAILPKGTNLISQNGDYYLGKAVFYIFIVCLIIDIVKYTKKK